MSDQIVCKCTQTFPAVGLYKDKVETDLLCRPTDRAYYAEEIRQQKEQSANDIQHGGNHYKQFQGFEPWDVITAWGLGYLDGTALKYIARWRHKNGIEDLNKAIHFLQKTVEVEQRKASTGKILGGAGCNITQSKS